ncbi:nucleotide-sugar transporter-domain-containing protein [Catenaria anguillulae PL171]|uniref:Nucleotide-sugar transporter-domain-containing protein n=1 Tax=Catenaria anguillulae PL171 TaxID=765915 RepID=A0A1Y2H735_9FUNG|nr:nucleotide-sugar transporter-domain-containing protein [Catenaria anguillulae PL171]
MALTSLLLSTRNLALLALVSIQVFSGIVYKLSVTNGKYEYSTASALVMAEAAKLVMSLTLYVLYNRDGPTAALPVAHQTRNGFSHDGGDGKVADDAVHQHPSPASRLHGLTRPTVLETVVVMVRSMPTELIRGLVFLAAIYTSNNHLAFFNYTLADPGTINLIKAGGTLISALMLWAGLGRFITGSQWVAILLQLCGVIVSQYDPCLSHATFGLGVYASLLFHVMLSALAGVINDHMTKAYKTSLHAQNAVLYTCGTFMNLTLYIIRSWATGTEPGFFSGYTIQAWLVVLSNAVIGLIITAVYKYSDAVVKTLASSFSTAILLLLGPVLFHAHQLSLVAALGCVVTFIASYLYMAAPKSSASAKSTMDAHKDAEKERARLLGERADHPGSSAEYRAKSKEFQHDSTWAAGFSRHSGRRKGIAAGVLVSVLLMGMWVSTPMQPSASSQPANSLESNGNNTRAIDWTTQNGESMDHTAVGTLKMSTNPKSPFSNTVAIIRFNTPHPERLAVLEPYRRFFKHVVISSKNAGNDTSLEVNRCDHSFETYHCVDKVMRLLEQEYENQDIDGVLYFQSDFWVRPQDFIGLSKQVAWRLHPPMLGSLNRCTNRQDYKRFRERANWWKANQDPEFPKYMKETLDAICKLPEQPFGCPDLYCSDWSDFYFIPRSLFNDWHTLSDAFLRRVVFHEIAVPTMIELLSQHKAQSEEAVRCSNVGSDRDREQQGQVADMKEFRCGRQLDFHNQAMVKAHFDTLVRWDADV